MSNFKVDFDPKDVPSLKDFKNDLPPMKSPEFDNHLDIEKIQEMVYTLLSETDCERDDKLRKCKNYAELRGKYQQKYMGLMMRYPSLYNMVLENGKKFDLVQFEQMMGMISKVRNNEVAESDASKAFGQHMVDKYVKPNLNKN
jgi:hypothetical protein